MQIKTKLKGLNVRGASHHLLLPIIAVLIVAGIGGFIMQRNSSAATVCRNATYYKGSRSECVRYAQYMLGVKADAAFGPGTQKKLKSVTGQTALNKTAWNKLCGKNYSAFVTKQRNAACIGGAYVTKIGNPTIGYKVCTKYAYKAPSRMSTAPYLPITKPKITCAASSWKTYSGVGSLAKANAAAKKIKASDSKYKVFLSDKKLWDIKHPTNKTIAPTSPKRTV